MYMHTVVKNVSTLLYSCVTVCSHSAQYRHAAKSQCMFMYNFMTKLLGHKGGELV